METVLLYVLGVVIMVVGVAVSIGLHELGHLVPAKRFGVQVNQYMIGFGRTLFSRKYGETEYGLKAIPLGGYISMVGMFPPAKPGDRGRTATTGMFETLMQDAPPKPDTATRREDAPVVVETAASAETGTAVAEPADDSRSFYRLSTPKRIVIMLGGPFMNLVIGVVLAGVVLVGFGVPQASTTVGSVSQCVLPATSDRKSCADSDAPSPGLAAGLKPGDQLVSMNGEAITTWNQATAIIRKSDGADLTIVVRRDGSNVTVDARPLLTEVYVTDDRGAVVENAAGVKQTQEVGFLGIGPATETVRQPITAVLPSVGDNIGRVVHLILNLPQRMVDIVKAAFGPDARDPNGPISVVGVGRLAGEITSLNTIPVADRASALLQLLGSLNIALFVFNLIPLLPLDGGHIAGALFESIRRRIALLFGRKDPGPVDTAKIIPLTLAVVAVLGAMSLLLVYADIVKPISIL